MRGQLSKVGRMINATISSAVPLPAAKPVEAADSAKRDRDNDAVSRAAAAAAERRDAANEEDPGVDRAAAAETVAQAMFTEFPSNASLEIAVNDQDDGFVYRAVDRETGEVIKQFPAEEVLERLERMAKTQGLAVDGRV